MGSSVLPQHYYDPSEMSRYQSVSVAPYYQHASSTDPTIASGAITRDHGVTGFPGEGSKFGVRGSDVTSPVSSNPTQQPSQHQQGIRGSLYVYMYVHREACLTFEVYVSYSLITWRRLEK